MEHMQHLNWASVYIAKLRGQFAAWILSLYLDDPATELSMLHKYPNVKSTLHAYYLIRSSQASV